MSAPISIATIIDNTEVSLGVNQVVIKMEDMLSPKPGQFFMLVVFGIGDAPFSISDVDTAKKELTFTIRDVGNVTHRISKLKTGEKVGVKGPFGEPWPLPDKEHADVIVMAGGIGIIPMRPLIRELVTQKNDLNQITILYGAREPKYLLFEKELQDWHQEDGVVVQKTVDKPDEHWQENIGSIVTLLNQVQFTPASTQVYICGPEIMMHYSAIALMQKKVPQSQIYLSVERNMQCGEGLCGHCMVGPYFVCKDGTVFPFDKIEPWLMVKEL